MLGHNLRVILLTWDHDHGTSESVALVSFDARAYEEYEMGQTVACQYPGGLDSATVRQPTYMRSAKNANSACMIGKYGLEE